MSELHLALLLLAAVLLVLLFGYNKWQERRALQRLDTTLRSGVGDALLEPAIPEVQPTNAAAPPGRIEPKFGSLAPIPPVSVPEEMDQPTIPGDFAPAPEREGSLAGWIEDPLLDCVLELRCSHAVDGVTALDAIAGLQRQRFALPVHVAAWDARTQQWVHPDRFGFYTELLVAIQLANRRVALDEVEASRFLAAAQQMAVALDADFDAPDVGRLVNLATELRDSSGQFDVQIGLTLLGSGESWSAERLKSAAEKADMVLAAPGLWRRLDEAGNPLFTFAAASLLKDRLVMELDVPLAPADAQPLRSMFAAASLIALDLGAQIVDDNGEPVDAASLTSVERKLEELYERMRQTGYEPGSPRTLRLYG
ncbi:MAG TPA: hypothetical protein VLW55_24460 [Burkholderiaceae bacterium]|nr:hypothetical protein [Burkholderiaceae bacterium]